LEKTTKITAASGPPCTSEPSLASGGWGSALRPLRCYSRPLIQTALSRSLLALNACYYLLLSKKKYLQ